jgi:hypothetical protein
MTTNQCLLNPTCLNGSCSGGFLEDCTFSPVPNECHTSVCNPQTGQCEAQPLVLIENKTFGRQQIRDASTLGPASLVSCTFDGCRITCTDYDQRAIVERVEARGCTVTKCGLRGAVFAECTIESLRTGGGLFQAWSCLYDKVTLAGKFDHLMLAPMRFPESEEFDAQLAREQAKVDWALDISGVEAKVWTFAESRPS